MIFSMLFIMNGAKKLSETNFSAMAKESFTLEKAYSNISVS